MPVVMPGLASFRLVVAAGEAATHLVPASREVPLSRRALASTTSAAAGASLYGRAPRRWASRPRFPVKTIRFRQRAYHHVPDPGPPPIVRRYLLLWAGLWLELSPSPHANHWKPAVGTGAAGTRSAPLLVAMWIGAHIEVPGLSARRLHPETRPCMTRSVPHPTTTDNEANSQDASMPGCADADLKSDTAGPPVAQNVRSSFRYRARSADLTSTDWLTPSRVICSGTSAPAGPRSQMRR